MRKKLWSSTWTGLPGGRPHAVAVSRHDATTLTSEEPVHHLRGRNPYPPAPSGFPERTRRRWLASHNGYSLLRRHWHTATAKRSECMVWPLGSASSTGPSMRIGPSGTTVTLRRGAPAEATPPDPTTGSEKLTARSSYPPRGQLNSSRYVSCRAGRAGAAGDRREPRDPGRGHQRAR